MTIIGFVAGAMVIYIYLREWANEPPASDTAVPLSSEMRGVLGADFGDGDQPFRRS